MAIYRIEDRGMRPYLIIDKELITDSLSDRAFRILAYILSKPDNWQLSVPNIEKIFNYTKASIYKALKELKQKGYYLVEQSRNCAGEFSEKVEKFFEAPHLSLAAKPSIEVLSSVSRLTDKRLTDKRLTDKRLTDKRLTDKRYYKELINKDLINKDLINSSLSLPLPLEAQEKKEKKERQGEKKKSQESSKSLSEKATNLNHNQTLTTKSSLEKEITPSCSTIIPKQTSEENCPLEPWKNAQGINPHFVEWLALKWQKKGWCEDFHEGIANVQAHFRNYPEKIKIQWERYESEYLSRLGNADLRIKHGCKLSEKEQEFLLKNQSAAQALPQPKSIEALPQPKPVEALPEAKKENTAIAPIPQKESRPLGEANEDGFCLPDYTNYSEELPPVNTEAIKLISEFAKGGFNNNKKEQKEIISSDKIIAEIRFLNSCLQEPVFRQDSSTQLKAKGFADLGYFPSYDEDGFICNIDEEKIFEGGDAGYDHQEDFS